MVQSARTVAWSIMPITKRAGVYRCAEKECRKDFTVTMKTVMERSKIALHKWLQAFHLMT
jgi:transposase-like protein